MKCNTLVSSLALLWALTEIVWCNEDIKVEASSGKFTITCKGKKEVVSPTGKSVDYPLKIKDDNSGEYKCAPGKDGLNANGTSIFVKFRSCDNCVELDMVSLAGLAVGNLMATIVLGVAVYHVATQTHTGLISTQHKRSDRKHLLPKEGRTRDQNDDYQELQGGNKEIYNTLAGK
ncbi:T-cell surface glycoprotein CD3 gamma chain-like [Nerophis lumbriciformis]|uniref:T-cell surface glycoprotein CD3 gamma chain-like n=1 Tax=Nerophis lumbriciformis TaxID=546530 RepID=UPI002ADF0B6A|nr:T-cell surface glycoprotein CD3 delta chain-like [Nerophis lumbriciformis]